MAQVSPSELIGSKRRSKQRSRQRNIERKKAGIPPKIPGTSQYTAQQQMFICWLIASYHKRKDAVAAFADRFPEKNLTKYAWEHYCKTAKWRPVIDEMRQQYCNDLDSLPLTQKKIRVMELTKLYEEIDWQPEKMIELPVYEADGVTPVLDEDGNPKIKIHVVMKKDTGQAASIIRQIAEEMNDIRGGSGIFVGDGGQVQIAIIRKEDQDAKLDQPVRQKLLADGAIDLSPA